MVVRMLLATSWTQTLKNALEFHRSAAAIALTAGATVWSVSLGLRAA